MAEQRGRAIFFTAGEKRWKAWLGPPLFALGLALYLFLQVGMVRTALLSREAPVETDDAYTYIIKAEQMRTCFFQDCPALQDLREQLSAPVGDPELKWRRYREFSRAFVVYHPLHSLILNFLHLLGWEWEEAYNLVFLGGSVFLGLAVAYWLFVLWGPGPAGIALGFLAFRIFPGQGLHYVVPSNLALGCALVTWALAVRQNRLTPWLILPGILAMLCLHPMGRVYAVVSVIYFFLFSPPPRKRLVFLISVAGIFLVGLCFLLPHLVSRPLLAFQADPAPPGFSFLTGIMKNFRAAGGEVYRWCGLFGGDIGWLGFGLFLTLGFTAVEGEIRKRVGLVLAPLVLLLGASLFHVLPRYPAEMFSRLWIPVAVVLMGAVGGTTLHWFPAVFGWIKRVRLVKKEPVSFWTLEVEFPGWQVPIIAVGIGYLIFLSAQYHGLNLVYTSERAYARTRVMNPTLKSSLQTMIQRQPVSLDPNQPSLFFSRARGDEAVLYLAEVPMHFYLSHGALSYRAVFYPGLAGTPEEKRFVHENENLGFLVAWNPLAELPAGKEGGLVLTRRDRLEVESLAPLNLSQVFLRVRNPSEKTLLLLVSGVTPLAQEPPLILPLPPGDSGWVPLTSCPDLWSSSFVLRLHLFHQAEDQVKLLGFRLAKNDTLNWPWAEGIKFILRSSPKKPDTEINFDPQQLCPQLSRRIFVIADQGSTALAEIHP